MTQYKVPQDVQREDQILWFITLRQLIILLVGFGISYLLFISLKETDNELSFITTILIWIPAALATALAFLKIKSIPLLQFILLIIEQTFFRLSKRHWIQGMGSPFVSMTTKAPNLGKKKKKLVVEKNVSKKKIKNLAQFLDGQKTDFATSNNSENE